MLSINGDSGFPCVALLCGKHLIFTIKCKVKLRFFC